MNVLSLYSGVGGIDLAAHWAGMFTVAMCEQDAFCRSILSRHWPGVPIFESDEQVTAFALREWGIPAIDIIVGGPPCQPFSVAGRRGGATDPRHRWPEMARIIGQLRPAYVLVENVAGFSDVAEQLVRADLDGLRYRTVRIDLPAAGVGAPHKRERIFVVAYTDRTERDESESVAGSGRAAESRDNRCGTVGDTERAERWPRDVSGARRIEREDAGRREEASRSRLAGTSPEAVADDDRAGLSRPRLHLRSGQPRETTSDTDGCGAGMADANIERRDDAGRGAGEVQRELLAPANVRRSDSAAMGNADERGRREQGRSATLDAADGAGAEELDIEPCPDGDGRWHVESPWDACVNDAGLARIRAEHADAIAHGEYGYRVADANSSGRRERRRTESARSQFDSAECGGGAPSGDATGTQRLKERRRPESPEDQERTDGHERPLRTGWARTLKSRLGRAAHVVSDRLDVALWPAAYQCEQYGYERPRITTVREFRRKRLKALGNAVCPLQALPLLALIYELWRAEQEAA